MANLAVGYTPQSKADVNQFVGTLATSVFQTLRDVRSFKAWLDTKVDADLIALGYVQAEVDVIRSTFNDLKQLADIHDGLATLAVAKDFNAFAKQVRRAV